MEATRKVGLYESMDKHSEGVVYKLAGKAAKFFVGDAITPTEHKVFKTFEDREAYIEKFFKGLVEKRERAAKWNRVLPL